MKIPSKMILYVLVGMVSFFIWMILVFPYDALKSRILTEIENQTRGRYLIEADDLDLSIFGSLSFKNLKVIERSSDEYKTLSKIPKLKIGFSPFIIFTRDLDIDFTLFGANKGTLSGYIENNDKYYDIEFELENYSLKDLDFIPYTEEIPFQGKLKGESKVKFFPKRSAVKEEKSNGNLEIFIDNLSVGPIILDSIAPAMASQLGSKSLTIPKIKVSSKPNAKITGQLNDRRLNLQVKMGDAKTDFAIDLNGNINLNLGALENSNMSFSGGVYLSDKQIKAIADANKPKGNAENGNADIGTYIEILKSLRNDKGQFPIAFSGNLSDLRSFKLAGNELL